MSGAWSEIVMPDCLSVFVLMKRFCAALFPRM